MTSRVTQTDEQTSFTFQETRRLRFPSTGRSRWRKRKKKERETKGSTVDHVRTLEKTTKKKERIFSRTGEGPEK